jgi:hypothetical protein
MTTSIVSHNSYATVVPSFQSAEHPPKQRGSVYEIVTARILEQLERGVVPWRKPLNLPHCGAGLSIVPGVYLTHAILAIIAHWRKADSSCTLGCILAAECARMSQLTLNVDGLTN